MQFIAAVTIVVPDYGQAPAFYVGKLGFTLVEDTKISDEKRWVLVSPPGSRETRLLLAKSASKEQKNANGSQTGGRVFLFLQTDDFEADLNKMKASGVHFCEAPRREPYGQVSVFEDPFGNKWDLI